MPSFSRSRSRTSTVKTSGVQTIGKKYAWDANINAFQANPIQSMAWDANLPWLYGEYTGDEIHPGPPYRQGGPFRNLKVTRVTPYWVQGQGTYDMKPGGQPPWNWRRYVGGFHPPAEHLFGGPSVSNTSLLNPNSSLFPGVSGADCDRAWRLSKPRIERANLFVTIAELRDLPRMLKSTAKHFHDLWKDLGSGQGRGVSASDVLLNQEFGWRPFLADINKMIDLVHKADRIIKNHMDRNGQPVRRKITLVGDWVIDEEKQVKELDDGTRKIPTKSIPSVISDVSVSVNNGLCCLPVSLETGFFSVPPTYEVREIVTDHITATSKWTYYNSVFDAGLEGFSSSLMNVQRYLTLYGLRITPSNVYRAMPWTWLIDWFSNFGDLVDRMSDAMVDEVVCWYLYVTKVRTFKRVIVQQLPFRDPGPLVLQWEKVILTKERVSASSPYGFSLSVSDLTPRQLLILGALGWRK